MRVDSDGRPCLSYDRISLNCFSSGHEEKDWS
jgi:hypothetical protein